MNEQQFESVDFWKGALNFPGLDRKLRILVVPPNQGG